MNVHCGTSQLIKVELDETSKLNVANQALLAYQKVLQMIERDRKRCREAENIRADCFNCVKWQNHHLYLCYRMTNLLVYNLLMDLYTRECIMPLSSSCTHSPTFANFSIPTSKRHRYINSGEGTT